MIVNGYAGKKVNACLDGKRIASNLAFGAKAVRFMNNKKHVPKFVPAGAGCGAPELARRAFDSPPQGLDATLVLTKRVPRKVVTFDNLIVNASIDDSSNVGVAIRHASDLGKVVFNLRQAQDPIYVDPTLESPSPHWVKGDQLAGASGGVLTLQLLATRPGKSKVLAKTPVRDVEHNVRTEVILVGDLGKNARFVHVKVKNRPLPSPTPAP